MYKENLKTLFPVVQKMGEISVGGKLIQPDIYQWLDCVNSKSFQGRYYVESYIDRILAAVAQGQQSILNDLAPFLTARHPSQLYQGVMEGLLVFLVLIVVWRKPQKPGVMAALWGVVYATMRIVGEQFRMPDAHIGFQWLGLTRGQWLSVAMLMVFVAFLIWTVRRPVAKMGGWATNRIH